jgi:hypothetical protein
MKFITTFIISLLFFLLNARAQYFELLDESNGVDFNHNMGNSNDFYYPEIVGSGVALIDFDNDGDLDIYMVQSGAFKDNSQGDQLYKNLLMENKKLSFTNVTKEYGISNREYGIGVAVADVNNDGWQDLLVTNLHQNKLLLNQSGKSFKLDTTSIFSDVWSVSASFCDINNDGWEDLYVSNYVNWSTENHPKCYNSKSKQDYCGPSSFQGLKDSFYLNNKGKLENKTSDFFNKMPNLPGLNVICQDINDDGWNDFIVANDGERNLLWLNQSGKFFKETGYLSGLAVNSEGKPEASMGMASADYDLDGDLDVFFTHLMNESNTLYKNNSNGFYQDVTNKAGLSRNSFAYTGWAAGFIHVNNDIFPDLLIFNGAVADTNKSGDAKAMLEQSNQLLLGSQTQKFILTDEASLKLARVSRGAAFGDLDNDGDIDVVANNNNSKAEVFINQLNPKKWIGYTQNSAKDTQIFLVNKNKNLKFRLNTKRDGSYASAQDGRVLINESQLNKFESLDVYRQKKLILSIKLSELENLNSYQKLEIK